MKNAVHADPPTLCPSCRALRLAAEHGKVVPHLSNEGFYEELVTGKIKMKRAPRFKFHDEADANKSRPARKRRRVHASAEPEVEGEGESDSSGDSSSTSSSSSSTSSVGALPHWLYHGKASWSCMFCDSIREACQEKWQC